MLGDHVRSILFFPPIPLDEKLAEEAAFVPPDKEERENMQNDDANDDRAEVHVRSC